MTALDWVADDGGRADAGFRGQTGDCAARALAIATRMPYREAYDLLNDYARQERRRTLRPSNARTGYHADTYRKVLADLGWTWTPTMTIGSGTTVHLAAGEVPMTGRVIIRASRHYTALVDGVVHDTHDPGRDGTRAVYGYWTNGDDA